MFQRYEKKIIVLETTCEEWLHAGHLSLKEQNRGKYYKEFMTIPRKSAVCHELEETWAADS